jgi:flap endonuclease-1
MGIKQLFKFISENAPKAVTVQKMENYTGRTLAIDASTCIYQFLIAVRSGADNQFSNLTNDAGEVTSHITGFLSRTIRMLEAGIKPVYVFDGKPPDFKLAELELRRERKEKAEEDVKAAAEAGDQDALLKATKRTVRADKKMNEDAKKLLRLLGCPVVDAPSEAEATCAALAKSGKVYAAVTEDMDVLTFGTPRMVKNLFSTLNSGASGSGKGGPKEAKPVVEVDLAVALEQLDISMDQFIDFCILCGCDYCGTIRGVGPAGAFKSIAELKSIEEVVMATDVSKLPEGWEYAQARQLFLHPEVSDAAAVNTELAEPDYDGLRKFLVEDNQFSADRIEKQLDRLRACRKQKTQMRLDNFFTLGKKEIKENEKFDPFASKRAAGGASGPAAKKQKTASSVKRKN